MSKFKVGDLVRVIGDAKDLRRRYVGQIDTIEMVNTSSLIKRYYLKGCHLTFLDGTRLYFYGYELELVKEFYWMKKSIHGKF